MRKILALVMVVAMIASLSTVIFAADDPKPIAAYDFTGSKKSDTSDRKLPDIALDEESDERSDDDRKAGRSARASFTDEGLLLENGFFSLPDNVFSDLAVDQITGLTVSFTVKKGAQPWGNEWSERFFSFSSKRLIDDHPDEKADNAIYMSYSGNVGTGLYPYNSEGAQDGGWLDGALGDSVGHDAFRNITLTYDIASNTVLLYLDGEQVATSADTPYEIKASLTAEQIKSLTALTLGIGSDGGWGMWGFMTFKNVTIYASTLTAAQVKTLATTSLGGTVSGGNTTTQPSGGSSSAPQTGVATVALAIAALGSGAYVVSKKRR